MLQTPWHVNIDVCKYHIEFLILAKVIFTPMLIITSFVHVHNTHKNEYSPNDSYYLNQALQQHTVRKTDKFASLLHLRLHLLTEINFNSSMDKPLQPS